MTRFVLALLCAPIAFTAISAQAPAARTVVTVHQGAETFPTNPITDAGIERAFKSRPELAIDYFAEYLESDFFPEESTSHAFEDYLRKKYARHPIDVVIATTDTGLRFVLEHRADIFHNAAIVYSGLAAPDDTLRNEGSGVAYLRIGVAYLDTLQVALAQNPEAEQVFVVANGVTPQAEEMVRNRFREYPRHVELTFIIERSLPSLLAAVAQVPPRSVILYQGHQRTEPGRLMYADEIAPLVVNAARVPVYGTNDFYIGSGIVGGVVRDTRETGARLGAMALSILTGTRARD
ncbi:MAG TPA: hypothetical protein VF491_02895, partial [Vicinamibacterales bacterium]